MCNVWMESGERAWKLLMESWREGFRKGNKMADPKFDQEVKERGKHSLYRLPGIRTFDIDSIG